MRRHAPKKSFLNEETRSLTTNAVGIRRQAGRGRRPGGARTERATAAPSRQPIADRGYDHEKYRRLGIRPVIARRQTEHGSDLGRYRWVVELTLPGYTTSNDCSSRYERRDDIHHALLALGCRLVGFRRLRIST